MNIETDREDKQCGHCKKWFKILTGKWIAGWFHTTCPHCQTLLKTQTPWFELRVAEPNSVCECGEPSTFNDKTGKHIGCCDNCIPF